MIHRFSVLMSVYKNDNPSYFLRAINSVNKEQSCVPDEIILVVDGPVPNMLKEAIQESVDRHDNIRPIWLPDNVGLGNALKTGLEMARNPIIARMDSDDIAVKERFSLQISYLNNHPDIAIVGGNISEFIDNETNIIGYRKLPKEDIRLKTYIKRRCPFNHMTVMFRKESILKVGNYRDWHYNEDYYLWIRMAEAGYKFANLPDTLVNVRVGKDMYRRRGGWKYFKSEARLQGYMLNHRIISLPRYVYNVAGRFAVQVAMPNWLRGYVFQKLFRK